MANSQYQLPLRMTSDEWDTLLTIINCGENWIIQRTAGPDGMERLVLAKTKIAVRDLIVDALKLEGRG